MYAFSRTVFIIVKFLKLVLNYHEMHQSGRKRFVNDRTSYLKDFNFQVNFTILSAPFFFFSSLRGREKIMKKGREKEEYHKFLKLDKKEQ